MAETDFLALIDQGAEQWNQWRAAHPKVKPDLGQAYLFGETLDGFDFSGVNLARACLIGASLKVANLQGACLQTTYATSADFSQANLSKADLTQGSFSEANFTGANLSQAVAIGTNLSSAQFAGACLHRWQVDLTKAIAHVQGTQIFLKPKQRNRHPKEGNFQPGELTAYLQQIAPATQVSRPAASAPIITVNLDALSQLNQELLTQVIDLLDQERLGELYESARAQLMALASAETTQSIRLAFHPDSPNNITPGALNQRYPNLPSHLARHISQLKAMVALKQAGSQINEQLQAKALALLIALSQSALAVRLGHLVQQDTAQQVIAPFKPDSPARVTVGALHRMEPDPIEQCQALLSQEAIAQYKRHTVAFLRVLFTPDGPERITPGKLAQLPPETRQHIRTTLKLDQLTRAKQTVTAAAGDRMAQQCQALVKSAVAQRLQQFNQTPTVHRITQHFQPDSPNRVTPGRFGGLTPAQRQQLAAQVKHYLDPKYAVTHLETLYHRHPVTTGLGAAVSAIALVIINVTNYRSEPSPAGVTAQPPTAPITAPAPPNSTPTNNAPNTAAGMPPLTAITVANPAGGSTALPCLEAAPATPPTEPIGYKYENGAVFHGQFTDGRPADGRGTLLYPTGNRYDGEYKDGQRHGCGTFTFANGRRYIGQLANDEFNGQGTWILENGERYIGNFKNNKCDGAGTFIFVNGSSKSGTWAKGKLLSSDLTCDQGSLVLPTSPDM